MKFQFDSGAELATKGNKELYTVKLVNFRAKFATNSSSSHSILILPKGMKATDEDVATGEFGWNLWTAASSEAKRDYAALILSHCLLKGGYHPDLIDAVTAMWTGRKPSEDAHIDHQSMIELPLDSDHKTPNKKFFQALKAFLLREDVVIVGGNDNDDLVHPLAAVEGVKRMKLGGLIDNDGRLLCREDPRDGSWTLFNKDTGGKFRVLFDPDKAPAEGSHLPELVDLKITDHCHIGCPFCYQASTPQGKHAKCHYIEAVAYALGKMGVFEVACGGGETTLYEDTNAYGYRIALPEVLHMFKNQGVTPNFTTKLLTWLHDDKVRTKVLEQIGGFAFSVENEKDVRRLVEVLNKFPEARTKASVQYIVGCHNSLDRVLSVCGQEAIHITLLGLKQVGFAAGFTPTREMDTWVDTFKANQEEHATSVSIDTVLAAYSKKRLEEEQVPNWSYHIKDGLSSMYIDAVSWYCDRSSYEPDQSSRVVLPNSPSIYDDEVQEAIEKAFASFKTSV